MEDQEKQWVNVSKNPVYLADGSLLAPGEVATEEQAKSIAGSLFAKSGAIALSAPSQEAAIELECLKLDLADAQAKIKTLESEREKIDAEGVAAQAKIKTLEEEVAALKKPAK